MRMFQRFERTQNPYTRKILVLTIVCLITALIFAAGALVFCIDGAQARTMHSIQRELHQVSGIIDEAANSMTRTAHTLSTVEEIELFALYPNLKEGQEEQISNYITEAINIVPSINSVYLITSQAEKFMVFNRGGYRFAKQSDYGDQQIFETIRADAYGHRDISVRATSTKPAQELVSFYGFNGYRASGGTLSLIVINTLASYWDALLAQTGLEGEVLLLAGEGEVAASSSGQYRFAVDPVFSAGVVDDPQTIEWNGEKHYAMRTESNEYGLYLLALVPATWADQSQVPTIALTCGVVLAVFAMLAAVAVLLLSSSNRSVMQLLNQLQDAESRAKKRDQGHEPLRDLVLNARYMSAEQLMERFALLGFDADMEISMIVLEMDEYLSILTRRSIDSYNQLLEQIAHAACSAMPATLCHSLIRYNFGAVHLLYAASASVANADLAADIDAALRQQFAVKISVLFSQDRVAPQQYPQLEAQFRESLNERSYRDAGAVIDVSAQRDTQGRDFFQETFSQLVAYENMVRHGEFEEANALFSALVMNADANGLRNLWNLLTGSVIPRLCVELGTDITGEVLDAVNETHESHFTNSADMKQWLLSINWFLCARLEQKRQAAPQQENSLVMKVSQYIEHEYADPELNVAQLAKVIGVTPNYLSSLYVKETGHRLTESLQEVRLRHAETLLAQTDLQIAEVAAKCGFVYNVSYFQKLFKQRTGLTPTQYRAEYRDS